ncbi:MAG: hypothetical protein SOW71_01400, partial [Eubacteriales bacterium]|nr:hypothetical protein [Eubacteriales bacterium]
FNLPYFPVKNQPDTNFDCLPICSLYIIQFSRALFKRLGRIDIKTGRIDKSSRILHHMAVTRSEK